MKRINRLAIELNITVDKLLIELHKNGIKTFNKHSKLNSEEVEYLTAMFLYDKEKKEKADDLRSKKYHDFDENFDFTSQQKKLYKEIYDEYENLFKQVELLMAKSNQYWALNDDEIEHLINLKYANIQIIQDKMNGKNNTSIERDNTQNLFMPDGNKWEDALGDGEEGYLAGWNTD